MQWHPLFALLLRSLLEDYYEVRTDVPVGELPREADIVLLRRTAPAPFVGIWSHLSTWNVLEFKGPSDDPGIRDLDLLVELGLGIDRRLNEERHKQGQAALARDEMAWWYLANHIGRRFRAATESLLGQALSAVGDGVWRGTAFGHALWLVSRDGLPVDRESVPLHLVTRQPREQELRLVREVAAQPGFWQLYGGWLEYLHPEIMEVAYPMIRDITKEETMDLRPLIAKVGLRRVIDQIGLSEVVAQVSLKEIIAQMGLKEVIAQAGLKEVIAQAGLKEVLEVVKPEELAAALEALGARLTPEQIRDMKHRST